MKLEETNEDDGEMTCPVGLLYIDEKKLPFYWLVEGYMLGCWPFLNTYKIDIEAFNFSRPIIYCIIECHLSQELFEW